MREASATSTLRMRACGWGERTKHACSSPSTLTLSAKRPWPRSSASSSTRFTDLPLPKRLVDDAVIGTASGSSKSHFGTAYAGTFNGDNLTAPLRARGA
jgi:hypothetical protein